MDIVDEDFRASRKWSKAEFLKLSISFIVCSYFAYIFAPTIAPFTVWASRGSLYFLVYLLATLFILGTGMLFWRWPLAPDFLLKPIGRGMIIMVYLMVWGAMAPSDGGQDEIEMLFRVEGLAAAPLVMNSFLIITFLASVAAMAIWTKVRNFVIPMVALGAVWLAALGLSVHFFIVDSDLAQAGEGPQGIPFTAFLYEEDYRLDELFTVGNAEALYSEDCDELARDRINGEVPLPSCTSALLIVGHDRAGPGRVSCLMFHFRNPLTGADRKKLAQIQWVSADFKLDRPLLTRGYVYCGETGPRAQDGAMIEEIITLPQQDYVALR